ncbi:hypothetical protein QFW77_01135 [Luteimonas sp. RD2P54]|uniref:Prepilin-type N-terminal cleavage/methylation domain-containing protein n=1 Tax=Luteimonas endophytica TaxID=3042023 RepID=A0ABT6J456_9GAMM|nr:hypothetical protein [Luteimonas endophytica]MDH5821598.1 hypothetical protein [Luteimonas endophytica]
MSAHRQAGWSLVELAVVLLVMALLSVALVQVLPLGRQVSAADAMQRDLLQAEEALVGHARAHLRLPNADADGDGIEDPGAIVGWLPTRALGLPPGRRVHYRLPQPLAAASPGNRFQPEHPPAATPAPAPVNGLDFCASLAAEQAAAAPMAGLGVPAAFALAHAGGAGHERMAAPQFALPGSEAAVSGRPPVAALGLGELAARLACPDRVARVQGGARAAMAAYDIRRVAERYLEFRTFDIRTAELNKLNADVAVASGSFEVAFGVVSEVISILQIAAGWPPDAVAIAIGVAEQVVAVAQMATAIANLTLAVADQADAVEAVETARANELAAQANLQRMQALEQQARERLRELDAAGLGA